MQGKDEAYYIPFSMQGQSIREHTSLDESLQHIRECKLHTSR